MSTPRVEALLRMGMYAASIAVSVAIIAVMVPTFRMWLRWTLYEQAIYRLQLAQWNLSRMPPPAWTLELSREDLPEETSNA